MTSETSTIGKWRALPSQVLATGGDDKRVKIWKARWAVSAVGSRHEFPMFCTCFFLDLLYLPREHGEFMTAADCGRSPPRLPNVHPMFFSWSVVHFIFYTFFVVACSWKKFLHVLDLKMCRDERALEETTRVHGPDSTMVEHVNSVIIYMERSIYYLFLWCGAPKQ